MSSLYKLFKDTVLTEGRKEDVMAKFPNVDKSVIETLSQNDPSGNNKYLEWAVKQVNAGNNVNTIQNIVSKFHQNLSLITPTTIEEFLDEHDIDTVPDKLKKSAKDINIYVTAQDLSEFVNYLDKLGARSREDKEISAEGDRIYEDKDLLVVSPRTHRASCKYGMHSAWCVATSNTSHFGNYTKTGILYFFISKKDIAYTKYWSDKDNGKPPYKTALLLKDNGQASWWSKGDTNYANDLDTNNQYLAPFFTEKIKNAVLAHNREAIMNRQKRAIEETLKARNFYKAGSGDNLKENFGGFVQSKIYTPEQLVSIINNDNWLALYENSNTGKIVREQLGADVTFDLISQYLERGDTLTILKNLEVQEFFRKPVTQFSDDQNRHLALQIVEDLGHKPTAKEVGNDAKIYVDKWTLSPEGWEKYKNTTNYFMVGTVDGNNVRPLELIKIDRFDPLSHQELQIALYSAKSAKVGLYGITTEPNVLDEYLGNRQEMPQEVQDLVASKAKQIYPK